MPNNAVNAVFELVDVALVSDELGRLTVPLDGRDAGPFELPEGAVVTVALSFRVHREVDGLSFTLNRWREGYLVSSNQIPVGSFRPGGPYEVHLPAERLPVGRAACGVYDVTGIFTDGDGRELSRESHSFRIVHQPRLVHGRRGARAA
ncbi:hypothetical protein [Streptomyces venezuelae]|uniref:hypothetical protein n=1 Tax=Streptomyces venezuelae TaxID=54571 RepID=UPI001681BE07|nr:hypothetical protein [Streptomyces venezuelae]